MLALAARGGAQMIYFDMDEADVRAVMALPGTMFSTDSAVRADGMKAKPHPRGMGTFPRVFASYVFGRADALGGATGAPLLTLPEAVRRMTSLPAETFGLDGRGRLAEGYWADVVVFDPARIADRATYDAPLARPEGIRYVFVNGRLVLQDLSLIHISEPTD